MSTEPIPKTIPRSTLACPPAKNFTDHYKGNQAGQSKPSKNDNSGELMPNKESEKNLNVVTNKGSSKSNEKEDQFGSTGTNFKGKDAAKTTTSKVPSKASEQKTNSEIHVKKWVDYSTKYGLGYLLSDGSTGVYFNDSTKIIVDKAGDKFQYIEKKSGDKVDTVRDYKITAYPQERELMKKVTLLQHFRNYLYNENKFEGDSGNFPQGYVYVKKWMKTKHAIMFRLSNKIVQVNFTDKSEIILSSEQKLVTYIDLKGQRSEYPLATALDSKNTEMAKRLKYTKEILTHMLNGTTVPQSQLNDEIN